MTSRIERLLRPVWLINGVLLLALLVLGVLFVAGAWLMDLTVGDDPVPAAPAESTAAREPAAAVRFGAPAAVRGSDARIVLIRRGQTGSRRGGYSSGAYGSGGEADGPVVNVAFLTGDGGRLLLDRPAYISHVRWPGRASEGSAVPGDTLLRWVAYEMALEDGNGDGRLDHRDAATLYLSALDGTGLRRVLPARMLLRGWEVRDDSTLFVAALRAGAGGRGAEDEEKLPQRAFLVGADGRARPYAALDSLATAAARVLGP